MTFLHYDTSPVDVCLVFWKKWTIPAARPSTQCHTLGLTPSRSSTWGSSSVFRVVTVLKRNRPLKDKHDYSDSRYLILMCVCASVWPPLDKVHPEGKTDALFRQTFPWLISPLQSLFYFLTEVTLCKQIARATSKHFTGHHKCTVNTINRCCSCATLNILEILQGLTFRIF